MNRSTLVREFGGGAEMAEAGFPLGPGLRMRKVHLLRWRKLCHAENFGGEGPDLAEEGTAHF